MKKKKVRFKTEYTKTEYGWSDWISPISKGYLMKCCDCGLVHELDFKSVFVTKWKKEEIQTELPKEFQVKFRARRKK